MRDRWQNIYHIYHQSITGRVQVECPKSVLQFGHSMPTARAMGAQTVGPGKSQPLTYRSSAINQKAATGLLRDHIRFGSDLSPFGYCDIRRHNKFRESPKQQLSSSRHEKEKDKKRGQRHDAHDAALSSPSKCVLF